MFRGHCGGWWYTKVSRKQNMSLRSLLSYEDIAQIIQWFKNDENRTAYKGGYVIQERVRGRGGKQIFPEF